MPRNSGNAAWDMLLKRQSVRKVRHGVGFRQVWLDQLGICHGILSDGEICGYTDFLEYHEIFGENGSKNGGSPKMQIRVLLCHDCHDAIEQDDHRLPDGFSKPSMVTADMEAEAVAFGGRDKWMEYFGLIDRYQPQEIKVDRERPPENGAENDE